MSRIDDSLLLKRRRGQVVSVTFHRDDQDGPITSVLEYIYIMFYRTCTRGFHLSSEAYISYQHVDLKDYPL